TWSGPCAPWFRVSPAQWTAGCAIAIRPRAGRVMSRPKWLAAVSPPPVLLGMLFGAAAAFFWAAGFAAARHGLAPGLPPADLAVHRFAWAGVFLLPVLLGQSGSVRDLGGIGWGRGILLTLAGGPPLAIISYSGFLLVPLGHGGVIQPSSAAL